MATLRFDGIDDYLEGTGQGTMNGALTLAALIKPAATSITHTLLFPITSAVTASSSLAIHTDNKLSWYNAGTASFTFSFFTLTIGDWWLVALTRDAAPSIPRFHYKNITTGAAWTHENTAASSQASNPPSAAGGIVRIGRSGTNWLNGDMAIAGWWNGTALTDGQVNQLATNLRTSDWNALTPSSLTELTSLTPADLKGVESWTRNGALLTGANPPGWTFDGIGGSPPTNSVAPAVTGTPVAGQTLTCTTGTWTNSPTGYTYQWKRGGTNISGATSSTYTLVSADKSTSVKCTVTATNLAGSASTDSNAVTVSVLDALPDVGDVLIHTSTGWITLN